LEWGAAPPGPDDPVRTAALGDEMDNRTYTIRQLTKEFSVSARTLRFYEEELLIAPGRRGQTRIYSVRDRARVILILRGRRMGFSLSEIREFLDLYNPESDMKQLLLAKKKFEERIAAFERQKQDIDATVAELRNTLNEVNAHLTVRSQRIAAKDLPAA
jgi:DNA-binding transcriptional MerR regulator